MNQLINENGSGIIKQWTRWLIYSVVQLIAYATQWTNESIKNILSIFSDDPFANLNSQMMRSNRTIDGQFRDDFIDVVSLETGQLTTAVKWCRPQFSTNTRPGHSCAHKNSLKLILIMLFQERFIVRYLSFRQIVPYPMVTHWDKEHGFDWRNQTMCLLIATAK